MNKSFTARGQREDALDLEFDSDEGDATPGGDDLDSDGGEEIPESSQDSDSSDVDGASGAVVSFPESYIRVLSPGLPCCRVTA